MIVLGSGVREYILNVSVTRLDGVLDSLGDLSGLGLPLFVLIGVRSGDSSVGR